jgi:Tfp pilus assembly protein FimT
LIELMIAVGVMGIVFAMTIPAMSKFVNTARLMGARNTLMTDLRYARSLANSQRRGYELRLSTNGYSIVGLTPTQVVLNRALPRGVTIAHSDTASFFPWGLTETMAITLNRGSNSSVVRTTSSGQVSHD